MPVFVSKLDRALAACAKALPARLVHDYGASEFYTFGQIANAVTALKLPPIAAPYIYAMYLPEESYAKLEPALQAAAGYTAARTAFAKQKPAAPTAPGNFYQNASEAMITSNVLNNL